MLASQFNTLLALAGFALLIRISVGRNKCWPELDMLPPIQSNGGKRQFQELFQFVCLAGGDYEIFGSFFCCIINHIASTYSGAHPQSLWMEILPSLSFSFRAFRYAAGSGYYFPCDEPFRSQRGFMIEEEVRNRQRFRKLHDSWPLARKLLLWPRRKDSWG